MRRVVVLAAASLFAIAACGGTAPAGSRAPGASGAPAATPAPPGGNVDPNTVCAGVPTFSLNTPQPSFAADPALEARFPASIDGNARERVRSVFFIQQQCYYSSDRASVARFVAMFPPSSVPQISQGDADYTIDGNGVTVQAFRIPGTDPSVIFTNLPAFLQALGRSEADIANTSVAQQSLGGKNVFVVTSPDGGTDYSLVSGDVVFTVETDEATAGKVVAAIQ